MKQIDQDSKIVNLTVGELINIVEAAVKMSAPEGKTVGNLSVETFSAMMLDLAKTRAMVAANQEAETSARIFADIEAIVVTATTPFRVKSAQEAQDLANMMKEMFLKTPTLQWTVAMAVVRAPK